MFQVLLLWCPQYGWMSAGPSMQGTVPLQGLSSQHQCEGVYKDVLLGYDNNPSDPMLLLLDNSDPPSIVEQ